MHLLLLTPDPDPSTVLPALSLLTHTVHAADPNVSSMPAGHRCAAGVVDARTDPSSVHLLCQAMRQWSSVPIAAIVTEDGLPEVQSHWALDEILLTGIGPAELDARLRLLAGRSVTARIVTTVLGGIVIDETSYVARACGRPLNLTYREFELLNYLVQQPDRVHTRQDLLNRVWGFGYVGSPKTVDVHIRRLRTKLGPEHASSIVTVRNVGYLVRRPDHRGTSG